MPLEINVPSDGSVMAEVWSRLHAQSFRTRFYFDRGAGAATADLDAIMGAVLSLTGPIVALFNDLSADLEFDNVRGYGYNSAGLAIGWKDYTASMFDPTGGPCELATASWVVKKRTGLPGRSQRGRWYFPGVPTEAIQDGMVLEAVRAEWDALARNLGNPIDEDPPVGNLVPTIVRLNSLGNINTSKDIGECVPTWVIRQQRRREIGVGI